MSKTFLENINNKIKPYYALLSMIVFFLVTFISAYKYLISPSDLHVLSTNQEINYPITIDNSYDRISSFLIKNDTLKSESILIKQFLLQTTNLKIITLTNKSKKTLKGVKFKHLNIANITAYSVSTNFLTGPDESNLSNDLIFDDTRQIVEIKNSFDMPPNSYVKLKLWGNITDGLLNSILVNYDDGEAYFETSYNISGLKGYFLNYSFELLIIIFIIFITVYFVGIKQKNQDDI